MSKQKQERELLSLKAELLRLKLTADRLKQQQAVGKRKAEGDTARQLLALAEQLPTAGMLWKAAKPLSRGKMRVFVPFLWLLWQWWRRNDKGRR